MITEREARCRVGDKVMWGDEGPFTLLDVVETRYLVPAAIKISYHSRRTIIVRPSECTWCETLPPLKASDWRKEGF